MPPPNTSPILQQIGATVQTVHGSGGQPSQTLVDLLVGARNGYDWPSGTGTQLSQATILNLEASVAGHLAALNINSAHSIVVDVSNWAGNNANSHAAIIGATAAERATMCTAIGNLCVPGNAVAGLGALCSLPGISLVIASKIFRFCAPLRGAAVDRHASYFFNSLPVLNHGMTTNFVREWSNGRHTSSRLAIYSNRNYIRNRDEYVNNYLPLLANIANAMNALPALYTCAVTGNQTRWKPADIEMAAYYWWACNGPR